MIARAWGSCGWKVDTVSRRGRLNSSMLLSVCIASDVGDRCLNMGLDFVRRTLRHERETGSSGCLVEDQTHGGGAYSCHTK